MGAVWSTPSTTWWGVWATSPLPPYSLATREESLLSWEAQSCKASDCNWSEGDGLASSTEGLAFISSRHNTYCLMDIRNRRIVWVTYTVPASLLAYMCQPFFMWAFFSGPGRFTIIGVSIGACNCIINDIIKVTYMEVSCVTIYSYWPCMRLWCNALLYRAVLQVHWTVWPLRTPPVYMTPVSGWVRLSQLRHWAVHSWRWRTASCWLDSRCSPVPSHQPC